MRVYLFLIAFFLLLAWSLRRPYWSVILYVALFYLAPSYHWWGKAIHCDLGIRTSFVAGVGMLVAYLLHRRRGDTESGPLDDRSLVTLFCVFFGLMLFSTVNAEVSPADAWESTSEYGKRILMFFVMARLMSTERDLRLFVWANLIGCLFFGVEAVTGNYMVQGRLEGLGGPGTAESEGLAAHVAIFVPFLGLYLLKGEKWEKLGAILVAPFLLNLLILTRTRASFLSLGLMAVYFVTFGDREYRWKAVGVIVVGAGLYLYLADPAFWTRIKTIQTYESEGSASSRLDLWDGAVGVMEDYPLGVGAANFRLLSQEYVVDLDRPRPAHNTFLTIGAEQGWLGLAVFVGIWLQTWRLLRRARFLAAAGSRVALDCFGMEVALLGFMVAAVFVNRTHTDAFFWMCSFAASAFYVAGRVEAETSDTMPGTRGIGCL